MASGRILNGHKGVNHFQSGLHLLIGIAVLTLLLSACGTTGNVNKNPVPTNDKQGDNISEKLKNTLEDNRTEADDVFTKENEVPPYFLQKSSSGNKEEIGDPYAGFRVQIISTRDVTSADSIAATFRVWADRHIVGYFPKTYVVYDQPYYKVHIGNFQFQERAVRFTQMVKAQFPGAWVVQDRIEPNKVPKQQIRVVK